MGVETAKCTHHRDSQLSRYPQDVTCGLPAGHAGHHQHGEYFVWRDDGSWVVRRTQAELNGMSYLRWVLSAYQEAARSADKKPDVVKRINHCIYSLWSCLGPEYDEVLEQLGLGPVLWTPLTGYLLDDLVSYGLAAHSQEGEGVVVRLSPVGSELLPFFQKLRARASAVLAESAPRLS